MIRVSMASVVLLAAAVSMASCGKKPPKGEVGETRTGTPPGGSTEGTDGNGTGDRGGVIGEDVGRMKTIYFDFDRYNLRDDARRALDANADVLRNNADMTIMIEGHCDERGTDEYNLALGERRAQAAREYLTRLGVDPGRINVISYGEERPVAPGHDEESWALNRRGEFIER